MVFWPGLCWRYSYEACEEKLDEFNLETTLEDWIKININASKSWSKGSTLLGYVISDNLDKILMTEDKQIGVCPISWDRMSDCSKSIYYSNLAESSEDCYWKQLITGS